jgi:ABC-type nitrate/sulfonate/bicarbonate transport system permease component
MSSISETITVVAVVAGLVLAFSAGFLFGWRSAVRRVLTENEDLSCAVEEQNQY